MENLTIQDHLGPPPPLMQQQSGGPGGGPPPLGGGMMMQGPPPGPLPQLPPQMFTTAAQLLDLTDKKLMVALRDGRKLIGILRSWDQFANLVLQSTTERLFYLPPKPQTQSHSTLQNSSPSSQIGLYADIPRGTFLVRGENVLLLGEIDLDKDDDAPPGYRIGEVEVVKRLVEEGKKAREGVEGRRGERLRREGFVGEEIGDVV